MNRTVLILGRDLELVFWLGQTLDKAGYDAYPARSVEAAEEIVLEFHLFPDLVIIAGSLPGGAELITNIRKANEGLRVLAFSGSGNDRYAGVDRVYPFPKLRTESAKAELLRVVCAIFDGKAVPR